MCSTDPLRSTTYTASSKPFSLNVGDSCRKEMFRVIEKKIYKVEGGLL